MYIDRINLVIRVSRKYATCLDMLGLLLIFVSLCDSRYSSSAFVWHVLSCADQKMRDSSQEVSPLEREKKDLQEQWQKASVPMCFCSHEPLSPVISDFRFVICIDMQTSTIERQATVVIGETEYLPFFLPWNDLRCAKIM